MKRTGIQEVSVYQSTHTIVQAINTGKNTGLQRKCADSRLVFGIITGVVHTHVCIHPP